MTRRLLELPVDLIDDGPNVRSRVDIDLRRSIVAVGVLQPITVAPLEDDRYVCLYGHRRLAAARAAALATIPAIVERHPDELPIRQLIENQQRRAVDPLDVARTLRAYLDEHPGLRQRELADKLGRSAHWVSTRLQLLDMDEVLQRRVAAGEVPLDQAYHAHKAATVQSGRGRPRVLRPAGRGGAPQVVIELEGPGGAEHQAQATIELVRGRGHVELLLEDGAGYGVTVTLTPAAARLLGLRLTQAFQASQAGAAA